MNEIIKSQKKKTSRNCKRMGETFLLCVFSSFFGSTYLDLLGVEYF